jgi:hypothetical protein
VDELYWLARNVAEDTGQIFSDTPPGAAGGSYIKVDHALHRRIYGVLATAAKISALISERPRQKDQSKIQHETLLRRARWLKSLLTGLSLSGVTATKVRNTVEHFDEYLDDTSRKCSNGTIALPAVLPIDMAFGHRDLMPQLLTGTNMPGATVYSLRVYLADERVFINCGTEISIGQLHDECGAIQTRLKPLLPDFVAGTGGQGSSMIVLTDQSFG